MLVAALKDHGVDARAVGALTAGFRAEAPGVIKVMVREADLDDATRVLETICDEIDNDPIDWSQVDVGDPET